MALVSTFELLVKPIAPAGTGPAVVARTVAQGYFLTIANTGNIPANLRLQFTANQPNIDLAKTATFIDINGTNVKGDLIPTSEPTKFNFNITVPGNDTILFTLLPDLVAPNVVTDKNLEIRGYVEVFRSSLFGQDYNLLLTPEHRGTFLPQNINAPTPDFDQLAYALPTANGSSLYQLKSLIIPPVITPATNGRTSDVSISASEMQEMIGMMAEQMKELEQRSAAR
ncbi:hypothetical protein ACE1CI_08820 [Aerosakkonemataceae cyanobacterium BLCC-F50]|uniref:CARDB domain-containing protein n=1 Tax=Floridaenema flaviceps BLCC-F50 TaxID=3153642 RepID=A0ABV4XN84_9CYAN